MTPDELPAMVSLLVPPVLAAPLKDAKRFRQTMGSFPTPVTVVTALDTSGEPRGLTCSAVCSVSMDPPTMLVCVNRRNGSLRAIRHSNGFVVNLLREGRHKLSDAFASPSAEKFDSADWQPSPGTGLPVLGTDVLAYVECDLQAEITAGSHAILVGLVRSCESDMPGEGPLIYYDRTYGRWVPHAPGETPGRS
jgi:flavin reductase (DIM6/NTAB) family NADH-FMN oxidoreductase RutF